MKKLFKKNNENNKKISSSSSDLSMNMSNSKQPPSEKATKVFSHHAAFSWWNKIGLFNLLWSVGFIFIFLAYLWKGTDYERIQANQIFAWILFGLGLILTFLCNTFYFIKKILCFNHKFAIFTFILSCFIPFACILIWIFAYFESNSFYNWYEVKKLGYVKPKKQMPHVYLVLMIIIFAIIVVSWVASWTEPYGTVENETNVAPAGFLYVLIAPIEGFVSASDLIIFLLIMGGFLAIVTESKALEAGLGRMVKKMKGKEIIMVPVLFILFSVGGTTYGMAEETIPFYLLLIPVFLAAGFDTYTAFLTILLGAGLGTASSILNPFVVSAAVDASNKTNAFDPSLSPSIGIAWRAVIYVVLVLVGSSYVTWYAWRVKKHPEKSYVSDMRKQHQDKFSFHMESLPEFTIKRKFILAVFGLTFVCMIISVITWKDVANTDIFNQATDWIDKNLPFLGGINKDGTSLIGAWGTWYLIQMSFLFFLASIIIGALSWQGHKHYIKKFLDGSVDFISVAIVIAIARGISVTISKTGLDQIIIEGLSGMMNSMNNAYLIIFIFFLIFIVLSMLIPSTSGFAGAVFPILAPAIAGNYAMGLTVSGQIASFSLASGMVNIVSPTSGIFVAALSVSDIPLSRFYKKMWPVTIFLFGLSIVLLMIGQAVNGNSFSDLAQANGSIF